MTDTGLRVLQIQAMEPSNLDMLHVRFTLWVERNGGAWHWRLLETLQTWHVGRRTTNGTERALRQAMVACLVISDELSLEDAAASLGCSVKTVQRDLAELEQVFCVMRDDDVQRAPIVSADGADEPHETGQATP